MTGKPQVIFRDNPLRKICKNLKRENADLKARLKAEVYDNERLREKNARCMADQNDLMRAALVTMDAKAVGEIADECGIGGGR